MARALRELVAGGVYHAVARGNRGSPIFGDDEDCVQYLTLLGRVTRRFRWALLAYCLMGNHVHLLVETPEPNLSAGMQWLHGKYGRYFNDRYELFGHVFQGRYKAIRQQRDEQLWHVLRYIALNPVEAGMCLRPRDYQWSSYRAALEPDAQLIAIDRLGWFIRVREDEDARSRYETLVEADPGENAP